MTFSSKFRIFMLIYSKVTRKNIIKNQISQFWPRLYSWSKGEKKGGGTILFILNTNYCREMKLVPIIMDYSLFQLDALKFFLGRLSTWGMGVQPNFNIFNVNPQIFKQNLKIHLQNCLDTSFHISDISLNDIRCRNYK